MTINPFEALRNIEALKKQASEMYSKMESIKCTGYSGANLIEAVVNGKFEVLSLKIEPSIIKPEEAGMLEVLIVSAINNASEKVRQRIQTETISQMQKA